MSLTAGQLSPPICTSSADSSTTAKSPPKTRSRPCSSSSASIDVRKPTRPKLTPITGTPVSRKRWKARSIDPSPPSVTARSGPSSSPVSSTPIDPASRSSRETASSTASTWLWVMTASRLTGLFDGIGDPGVELGAELGAGSVDEGEEELTVAFRSGQPRVYDSGGLCPPAECGFRDLSGNPPPDGRIAHDTGAHVLPAGLELRLHEHDGLPARRCELEQGRERLSDADERDVADGEVRRKRQLADLARIRPLEDDDPAVLADARVQLPVADVERDHACSAPLEQDVGEAAR